MLPILPILSMVAGALPHLKGLLEQLNIMKADSKATDVFDYTAVMLPQAMALFEMFETIKKQTEADYPEVWKKVSSHYAASAALNDKLREDK